MKPYISTLPKLCSNSPKTNVKHLQTTTPGFFYSLSIARTHRADTQPSCVSQVSLQEKRAVVEFSDDLIKLDQIKDAIEDLGFDASIVFGLVTAASRPQRPPDSPKLQQHQAVSSALAVDNLSFMSTAELSSNYVSARLSVHGMSCKNCVGKIERGLLDGGQHGGVASAKVSLADQCAAVVFDSHVLSLRQVAERIQKLGFEVVMPGGERLFKPGATAPAPAAAASTSRNNENTHLVPSGSSNSSAEKVCALPDPGAASSVVVTFDDQAERCFISVTGMTCASCVNNIERNVGEFSHLVARFEVASEVF